MSYTANKKPSELSTLSTLASDDVFVVGDTSDASEVAKTITKANLVTDLADETQTLTNKTFDANGTGNSISNIEVADLAAGVLDTDLSSVAAGDTTLPSAKAVKTYADSKVADAINDSTTDIAPSQNAVFDALALKAPLSSPTLVTPNIGAATGTSLQLSGLTASQLLSTDGSKNLTSLTVATYPSLTEVSYVKGVTSAIQTQLGLLAPKASPAFTGTVTLPTGLTGVLRADSGVVSTDTDVTDLITAASDTAQGKVELATIAETNTGTDATRAVTPDGLAGSVFGVAKCSVQVSDTGASATAITTGDGKAYIRVPDDLHGMNLVGVGASLQTVSSSGAVTVQIRRSRRSNATTRSDADMLSTAVTIDQSEFDTVDAATPAVINASNDDVQTGDHIYIDIDGAGTGAKGLAVSLRFQLP